MKYNEIRRLLHNDKFRTILEMVVPEEEYRGLIMSYCGEHNHPSEPKQQKDLALLRKCLKL